MVALINNFFSSFYLKKNYVKNPCCTYFSHEFLLFCQPFGGNLVGLTLENLLSPCLFTACSNNGVFQFHQFLVGNVVISFERSVILMRLKIKKKINVGIVNDVTIIRSLLSIQYIDSPFLQFTFYFIRDELQLVEKVVNLCFKRQHQDSIFYNQTKCE